MTTNNFMSEASEPDQVVRGDIIDIFMSDDDDDMMVHLDQGHKATAISPYEKSTHSIENLSPLSSRPKLDK